MGVDLSDLMGGDGVPTEEQMRGDDNVAESDAGAVDHPGGDTQQYEAIDDLDASAADDTDTGDGGQKPRKQLVPLSALQEERTKRQEMQQRLQEREQEQARINDRLTRLLEAQQLAQQPQQEVEQIPDFDDDPRGHVEGLKRQFQQELDQLRQFAGGQSQANQQAQHFQQVQQRVAVDENTYRATNPDYNDAAQFFNDRKLAEYAALGLDPVSARQQLAKDVFGVAQIAYQQGRNPAEALHSLAKAFGFNGKPVPGNGGQHQQVQHKQAPTSLSALEGASRAPDEQGKLTAASIAEMPDKDFDELWAKMAKQSNRSNKIKF